MQVVERTAMRVVIEHRAPAIALATAGGAAIGAIAVLVQYVVTREPIYLLGLAVAGVFLVTGLWLSQGVRITLDAGANRALWERTGLLPARREAALADVQGLDLLPASARDAASYTPVLAVGEKRWPLALRAVANAADAQGAIAEVLELARGRRTV